MAKTSYFMNTYNRMPAVFTHGKGVFLFDRAKSYLDWTSGLAVNCLGHGYPPLVAAIEAQAKKMLHVCNYFQSDTALVFAEKLVKASGLAKVFLCNSGAEANEGACKVARKYSYEKYGEGRYKIVTLERSFHGRTMTTLAATGQNIFHKGYEPFTEGFVYVPANDIDALEKAFDGTACGLLLEAIQGEGGVYPLDETYLKKAAELCASRDILFMLDEVQCGMGRTGSFFGYESVAAGGIKVDIVTLAKGLSGGVPSGAVLVGEKAADTFKPGDHGSTFGGNPLAAAAGIVVLDTILAPGFMDAIKKKGARIMDAVRSWKLPRIRDVRGRGLLIGVEISDDATHKNAAHGHAAHDIRDRAFEKGLLILTAGQNVLRIMPPYIISDDEIDSGLSILKDVLEGR
jgi:acetylornithine/N-succinyldiaminopimelate aminotransferase